MGPEALGSLCGGYNSISSHRIANCHISYE